MTGAAVRAYERSHGLLSRAMALVSGVHDGAWLGLAPPGVLDGIDDAYYRRQPEFLDEAYNRRGLWDWERAALERHFAPGGRIAVTGAGGGREVLALARMGFRPEGFEPNAALAGFANGLLAQEGVDLCVSLAERDAWPDPSGRYDGVIVGWGSYMLMDGAATRINFLRQARSSVDPGAPVLLSFFARRGTVAYFRVAARVGTPLRRLRGRPPVEPGDALRPNYVHFFTEQEIARELDAAGFDLLLYAEEPYGHAVGVARA